MSGSETAGAGGAEPSPAAASGTGWSAFHEASDRHRGQLAERGYETAEQLKTKGSFLGNAPWKTYWEARHPRFGAVFVKVNYGYDAPVNLAMGQKEAWLPGYFATHCRGVRGLAFPLVVDSWAAGEAFAVAFRIETLTAISLPALVSDPERTKILESFLRTWVGIQPPEWWHERFVLHDFGCHGSLSAEPSELSPFGFDLDENISIDSEGRLFVHDFEFIQWTTRGLQQTYLALKLLASKRQALSCLLGRGIALELLHQAGEGGRPVPAEQAIRSLRGKLSRREGENRTPRCSERWAEALLRQRCREH